MILSEYVTSYNNMAASMPAGLYNDADPPSLLTNSKKMAMLCDCSDRTVRNHLAHLRNLGVVNTRFHGRKHNYELWISNEFLYGGEEETKIKKAEISAKTPLSNSIRKIFPPNNIHREVFEKEKGDAELFIKHGESNHGERGRTGNEANDQKPASLLTQEEIKLGGATIQKSDVVAENTKNRLLRAEKVTKEYTLQGPRGLNVKYLNLLLDFWFYAWKVLYPNVSFSKEEQEKALMAISAGVYNDFSDSKSDREWIDFQVLQLAKLDKAGKYYDHHPEQYAPTPYAIAVAGRGYFDAENIKGFTVIDSWIKKEQLQKAWNKHAKQEAENIKETKAREILRKCRIDLEKQRIGDRTRKETLGKSILGIYQYYHNILRNMGKKYADMLDRQYMDQQARDFAPPKYNKAKRAQGTRKLDDQEPTVVYVEDWMTVGEGYYS